MRKDRASITHGEDWRSGRAVMEVLWTEDSDAERHQTRRVTRGRDGERESNGRVGEKAAGGVAAEWAAGKGGDDMRRPRVAAAGVRVGGTIFLERTALGRNCCENERFPPHSLIWDGRRGAGRAWRASRTTPGKTRNGAFHGLNRELCWSRDASVLWGKIWKKYEEQGTSAKCAFQPQNEGEAYGTAVRNEGIGPEITPKCTSPSNPRLFPRVADVVASRPPHTSSELTPAIVGSNRPRSALIAQKIDILHRVRAAVLRAKKRISMTQCPLLSPPSFSNPNALSVCDRTRPPAASTCNTRPQASSAQAQLRKLRNYIGINRLVRPEQGCRRFRFLRIGRGCPRAGFSALKKPSGQWWIANYPVITHSYNGH
ncbi:hypothetical protein DFH09DRAFT_1109601 [Mycena vulgaris]|nr:hypothetical protein DFH09DRAFT_1109601 [Mycena vulgaris]